MLSAESIDYSLRLTKIELCGTAEGDLTGIQTSISKYDLENNQLSTFKMEEIGTIVSETYCKTMEIDPTAGEFVSSMTMRFGGSRIYAIAFSLNTGGFMYAGVFPKEYTDLTRTFAPNEPMIGFFGSTNANQNEIISIGELVVQRDCRLQPAEEPTIIETQDNQPDSNNNAFSDQK